VDPWLCPEKGEPLEVDTLVVDDGSSDETERVASEHGVQLLKHSFNLGKGAALRPAFEWILRKDYQVVITLDADGQHDPARNPVPAQGFSKHQARYPHRLSAGTIWENDLPPSLLESPGGKSRRTALPFGYYG